jgi:hypothetical protein
VVSRRTRTLLLAVNGVLGLFIVADLGESGRGDNYLVTAIPYDLLAMVCVSGLIVFVDVAVKRLRRR